MCCNDDNGGNNNNNNNNKDNSHKVMVEGEAARGCAPLLSARACGSGCMLPEGCPKVATTFSFHFNLSES